MPRPRTAWGITFSAHYHHLPPLQTISTLALFGCGSLLLRSAGCIVNDLWDRDLDARVLRTRSRPLASGEVGVPAAVGLVAAQLAGGFAVLSRFDYTSMAIGASSLALVGVYPLMKRITYYPQFILGLTFNWGILLGWSVVQGGGISQPLTVACLYSAGVLWTVYYDTIYAHQDKKDDILAGVKSTALAFKENTRPILAGVSAATIGLLSTAGYLNGQGLPFYLSVGCAAGHLAWQLKKVDFDDPKSCWDHFSAARFTGLVISLGLAGDLLVQYQEDLALQNEELPGAGENKAIHRIENTK